MRACEMEALLLRVTLNYGVKRDLDFSSWQPGYVHQITTKLEMTPLAHRNGAPTR